MVTQCNTATHWWCVLIVFGQKWSSVAQRNEIYQALTLVSRRFWSAHGFLTSMVLQQRKEDDSDPGQEEKERNEVNSSSTVMLDCASVSVWTAQGVDAQTEINNRWSNTDEFNSAHCAAIRQPTKTHTAGQKTQTVQLCQEIQLKQWTKSPPLQVLR